MLKKLLMLSAAAMALVALLGAPASSQYVASDFTANIDDTTVTPGQVVTISGECPQSDEVVIAIVGEGTIGTIAVNDDDTFSGQVTIPEGLDPGTYTLTATCGDDVISIEITVLGDDGGTGPGPDGDGGTGPGADGDGGGPLARTGSPTDSLFKIGGGLLLAGAAATLFATKRRNATA